MGVAQLERLSEFVEIKREMGSFYTQELSDVQGIQLPIAKTEYADNIYWVFGIVLGKEYPISNREMVKRLAEEGIGARTFFWCMHEQPVYRKQGLFQGQTFKNAEILARKGFYIPSGLALSREQMKKVASGVKKVLKENI